MKLLTTAVERASIRVDRANIFLLEAFNMELSLTFKTVHPKGIVSVNIDAVTVPRLFLNEHSRIGDFGANSTAPIEVRGLQIAVWRVYRFRGRYILRHCVVLSVKNKQNAQTRLWG